MDWCPLNQIFFRVEVSVYFFTSRRQISLALLVVIGTALAAAIRARESKAGRLVPLPQESGSGVVTGDDASDDREPATV